MGDLKKTITCPNSKCCKAMHIPLNKCIVFTCPYCKSQYETFNGEYFKRPTKIKAKHIYMLCGLLLILFGYTIFIFNQNSNEGEGSSGELMERVIQAPSVLPTDTSTYPNLDADTLEYKADISLGDTIRKESSVDKIEKNIDDASKVADLLHDIAELFEEVYGKNNHQKYEGNIYNFYERKWNDYQQASAEERVHMKDYFIARKKYLQNEIEERKNKVPPCRYCP